MRIFKIFAVLLMAASVLTACNSEGEGETDAPDVTADSTSEEATKAEETAKAEETTKAEDTTETTVTVKPTVKDDFENCLFIGDSRTVGFLRYADTGKADVFASTGMNVFRIAKEEIKVNDEMRDLASFVGNKKYEKIYLMLGINEIGYDLDRVIKEYGEFVDYLREVQPDSILYLQANLHITHERSSKDKFYNNERLNYINDGIKGYADGNKIIYIDVNPVFDDADGGMKAEIAYDDFHPKGKYYTDWLNWIADNS